MSARGTMREPICRSSRRKTLRTMSCSCFSMMPASEPSSSMAWMSSSVTRSLPAPCFPSSRRIASVENDSSRTKGRDTTARTWIGRATSRAIPSALNLGDALGHQFADDDGEIGDHHDHQRRRAGLACLLLDAERLQPGCKGSGEDRLADDAVEDADCRDADLDGGEEAVSAPRRVASPPLPRRRRGRQDVTAGCAGR